MHICHSITVKVHEILTLKSTRELQCNDQFVFAGYSDNNNENNLQSDLQSVLYAACEQMVYISIRSRSHSKTKMENRIKNKNMRKCTRI